MYKRCYFIFNDKIEEMSIYNIIVDKQIKNNLVTHLSYWHNLLSAYHIKHWIMYDTLLRAVRDTNLDMNIGYFSFGMMSDDIKILDNINIPNPNYSISKNYVNAYDYTKNSIRKNLFDMSYNIKYNGTLIGKLYAFTAFNDKFIRIYDKTNNAYFYPRSTIPEWFILVLSCERISDKCYPAPRVASSLLDSWYGENWDQPITSNNINQHNVDISDVTNIANLIGYVRQKGIQLIPRLSERIKYIYPLTGKRWIDANDPPNYFNYT
jgi:hypothetical protein